MKAILSSLVLASAVAVAQQAAPEPTLKPGSEVSLPPLSAATWIQGEAPESFEAGKIYMFECWATWCGPCIAAIPHVNELHKKYYDKGLRVYGMNVWEDGEAKVAKFVKNKGDGMSYPVAYTGKGSAFEKDWLKAAGVRGIPHAFIVKDGKLLLTSHPSKLTDSVIEALLSGDDGAQKAVAQLEAATKSTSKIHAAMSAFRKAANKKDVEQMIAQIAIVKQADPQSRYLTTMEYDLLVAKKDWPAATKAIEEMTDLSSRHMVLSMTANQICGGPEGSYPQGFTETICKSYSAMLAENEKRFSPMDSVTLASLEWKIGKKAEALATAKAAAERAKKPSGSRALPAEPFTQFANALEEGKLPTRKEFYSWLTQAIKKDKADKTPAK